MSARLMNNGSNKLKEFGQRIFAFMLVLAFLGILVLLWNNPTDLIITLAEERVWDAKADKLEAEFQESIAQELRWLQAVTRIKIFAMWSIAIIFIALLGAFTVAMWHKALNPAHGRGTSAHDEEQNHKLSTLEKMMLSITMPANASTAKMLAGGYDTRPKKPVTGAVIPRGEGKEPKVHHSGTGPNVSKLIDAGPTHQLTVHEALDLTSDTVMVIGQQIQERGSALAKWNYRDAKQFAIFGANGTGKTKSVATLMVVNMLRMGWHVAVLDPKRGADWKAFGDHIERFDSDDVSMGHQLALVAREMERRERIMAEANVGEMMDVPKRMRPQPFCLVIEELGDTRTIAEGNGILDSIDVPLDSLMRRSRYCDIFIILIDQRPTEWPKATKANTKAMLTFKQGMQQGSAVGYYHAHNLDDNGEFAYNGNRYEAWFTFGALEHLLPKELTYIENPLKGRGDPIIRTDTTPKPKVIIDNSPPVEEALTVFLDNDDPADWFERNPGATQADLRRICGLSKRRAFELFHSMD